MRKIDRRYGSALRRRAMLILEHKRARARALQRARCTHSSFFFVLFFPFSPFFCFIEAGEPCARARARALMV